MDRISVYFDIDGVLGKWYPDGRGLKYPEEILDPANHYFRTIEPQYLAITLAKQLYDKGYDVRVYSATAEQTMNDKIEWVKEHMPFIARDKMFFCPLGADKKDYISNSSTSILIDDYRKNLDTWDGVKIKALNGINSESNDYPCIVVQNLDIPQGYINLIAKKNFETVSHTLDYLKTNLVFEEDYIQDTGEYDR